MSVQVELTLGEGVTRDEVPAPATVRNWVRHAAAAAGRHAGVVSVRVVGAAEGRALNRQWRGTDHATNVLSFPSGTAVLELGAESPLGDLAICAPVVVREAREQGKLVAHHWAHLLVHGTLHLFGFDHIDEDGARVMEALEVRLLDRQGIPDPYAMAPRALGFARADGNEREGCGHE